MMMRTIIEFMVLGGPFKDLQSRVFGDLFDSGQPGFWQLRYSEIVLGECRYEVCRHISSFCSYCILEDRVCYLFDQLKFGLKWAIWGETRLTHEAAQMSVFEGSFSLLNLFKLDEGIGALDLNAH